MGDYNINEDEISTTTRQSKEDPIRQEYDKLGSEY
ncbi:MAG: hypothetical protein ACJAXH_000167 [Colwellia sp.]|jgi:hypothetical protein